LKLKHGLSLFILLLVCASLLLTMPLRIQKAKATIQYAPATGSGEYSREAYDYQYLWVRNNNSALGLCNGGAVQYVEQHIFNYTSWQQYGISRGILFFNTSNIEVALNFVTLKLYVCENHHLPRNITVWIDSSGVYPRYPISSSHLSDYNFSRYDSMVGSAVCSSTGWLNITVNSDAVNTTGLTKFMLRTSDDVDAVAPTGPGGGYTTYYGIGFVGLGGSQAQWPKLVVEERPTIGTFQAPSGRININQYFYLNATVQYLSGTAGLKNATLTLNYSINLNWFNSTNTFTKTGDANGYCTLDSGIRTTVNSTAYKLSWKVKFSVALNWDVENAIVYIYNDVNGTNSAANLFITDYVKIDSFSAVDNRINVGATASFTVAGKYAFDNTAWSGTYTLNDTQTKSAVGKYWYKIASVTDSNYGLTAFQQTASNVYVIFDRAVITISANVTNPVPNGVAAFTVTATYDFDDSTITSFTVNTYRNSTHFKTGNFTDSNGAGTLYYYTAENFTEPTYGLTSFTSNTLTVYWSDYVALTIKTVDLNDDILTGALVYFNETSMMVDGNGLATKTGIIQNQIVAVKVKWCGMWVNGTWTTNMTTTKTMEAKCKVWSLTFNLKDNAGAFLTASPSQVYFTYPNGSTCMSLNTTTGSGSFKVANGTSFFKVKFQNVWVSANITLSDLDPSTSLVTVNCQVFKLTIYTRDTVGFAVNCPLVLKRIEDSATITLNGMYGLPSNPTTGEFNLTHSRYVWPQLSIQTATYVVWVYYGSEQRGSATTSLTSNTAVTVTINTASTSGPGPGPPPQIKFSVNDTYVTCVKGQDVNFTLTVVWSQVSSITISSVTFEDYPLWFRIDEELPLTKWKESSLQPEGTVSVRCHVTVPWGQPEGLVSVRVSVMCPTSGGAVSAPGTIYLTVAGKELAPKGSIPEYMGYAFLITVIALATYSLLKKRR